MFRFYYCRRTNRSYDRPFYYSQICRNYPHSRSYIAVRRHHILGNRTWKPVLSFHWNIRFGTPFLILYGLFSGIFLGGWIMALAEMADIFPIFARRSRFQRGLSFTILCIAAGKTVGALIYYYNGWLP